MEQLGKSQKYWDELEGPKKFLSHSHPKCPHRESNTGPSAYKADALVAELQRLSDEQSIARKA